MKIYACLFFLLLASKAMAEIRLPRFNIIPRDSSQNLRVVWTCPTQNRGEMPEEKEVEIYYNESGVLKFRPNIFKKGFNPVNEISKLFGRRQRSSSDVDQCLSTFLNTVPGAITDYRNRRCEENPQSQVCTQAENVIANDVGLAIRRSGFYTKYRNELAGVESQLPRPEAIPVREIPRVEDSTPIVQSDAGRNPEPNRESVTPEPRRENLTVRDEVPARREVTDRSDDDPSPMPPRDENTDRARAQLLDFMTDNYSKFDDLQRLARVCPNLGETPGVNAEYCDRTARSNSRFLTRLSQMFSEVRREPVTTLQALHSLECLPPNVNEFRDIEDLLRNLDPNKDCRPLAQVGDSKLFRKKAGHGGYTSGSYLLKKTADDAYEATLNLNFKDGLGASTNASQMMSKVRSCLGTTSNYLRGPDGSKLSIRVLSPSEANQAFPFSQRPPVGDINVRPNGVAIDSGNFSDNIDCPTITHEVLHHMGLCDEYKEERTDILAGMSRSRAVEWSCREVPEGNSIMKNHLASYREVVPQKFSCRCSTSDCSRLLQDTDPVTQGQRKILMTASPNTILGDLVKYCGNPNEPFMLGFSSNLPEGDKAYTNIRINGGLLRFENRAMFPGAVGKWNTGARQMSCQCPSGDQACVQSLARAAALMATNPPTSLCPFNTEIASDFTAPAEGERSSVISPSTFTIVTAPTGRSLLKPSHFDKILTGSCATGPSADYKKCADYAYIPTDSPACASKPAICSDESKFFGVSEQ